MKIKTKATPRIKSKKRLTFSKKKVNQAYAEFPVLRHFRLIEHKHTFKLIHHRHTSHLVLFVILIIVGFFLYASGGIAQAGTDSGSVLIGTIVPGPPPTIGATITNPANKTIIKDQNIITISGTCSDDSFVVIKDNELVVGSAACTSAGIFSLQIQIQLGKNILSAMNYDNLNQAGPETPPITITLKISKSSSTSTTPSTTITTEPAYFPLIPDNPSIITGVPSSSTFSTCNDYKSGKLPKGGELHVTVACVPRLFLPDIKQIIGVVVWGGTPPYALSINFNSSDNNPTLLSLKAPGYIMIPFEYAVPNTYKIQFMLVDQKKQTAIVQTTVQVSGEKQLSVSSAISNITNDLLGGKPWYESPVPFYLLAIAITLGFWGGDIFDRKYGAGYRQTKRRITA
jgi:hypothetical protein